MASQIISRRLLLLRLGAGPSPQQQLLRRTSPAATARLFSSPAPQPQRCSILQQFLQQHQQQHHQDQQRRQSDLNKSMEVLQVRVFRRACNDVILCLVFYSTNFLSHDYTNIFLSDINIIPTVPRTNCRKPRSASKTVGDSAATPPNGAPSCKPPRIP